MTRLVLATALALLTYRVEAATLNYACRVDGKLLVIKVDDAKNTLVWRGKTYRIQIEESCARFGWRAERNGEVFNFCAATQGYADFREGGRLIQCDQRR